MNPNSQNSLVLTDYVPSPYIEFANTSTLNSVRDFRATWNVPPNPNNYSYNPYTPCVIWNGLIPGNGEGSVIQPVLQWLWTDNQTTNPNPPPVWTVAAWYYNPSTKLQINTPPTIGPVTGEHVRGVVQLCSADMWVVYIYSIENQTINAPYIFVNTNIFGTSNVQPHLVLEARPPTNTTNYNFICGDVIFQDSYLLDINSYTINQNGLWRPFVNPVWNITQFQPLGVYIVGQWPTNLQVILNTHAQNALIPLPGYSILPTDPDHDNKYEDVDGNGIENFGDVSLFFLNIGWIRDNEPIGLFDFDGDGRITYNDVVALFNEIAYH
jgi:PKD repeat protein